MTHTHSPFNSCLVCYSRNFNPLSRLYRFNNRPRFRNVYICKSCGHIQLDSKEINNSIKNINDDFFSDKYKSGLIEQNNKKKLFNFKKRVDNRINFENGKVLDVGPGSGFLIDYFLEKNFQYHFIVSIEKFSTNLISKGGISASDDIYFFEKNLEKKFDFIVLRHVIEHLDRPLDALNNLRKYLKTDGLLYMALPNALKINNISKGFRTSFLRDAHISYFTEMNIMRLIKDAGLKIIDKEIEGELYFLLSRGEMNFEWENQYFSNKAYYHELLIKSKKLDIKKILINEIKSPIRWIIKKIKP